MRLFSHVCMCVCVCVRVRVRVRIHIHMVKKKIYTVVQPGKMMILGIFGTVTQIMCPGSVPDPCWPRSGHFRAISEDFRALVGV